MSNLIITIIAIILVAVAAIMAVWYGGNTYASANTKSYAVMIKTQADLIYAAWQSYALDHNGNFQLLPDNAQQIAWGVYSSPGTLALIPNYLTALPMMPSDINYQYPNYAWRPYVTSTCGSPVASTSEIDSIEFRMNSNGNAVCQYLVANYGFALEPREPPGYTDCSWPVGAKYVCRFKDTNANSQLDSGDTSDVYDIIIKIY